MSTMEDEFNGTGENTGGNLDGATAGSTSPSGNSESHRDIAKAQSYLEQLREKRRNTSDSSNDSNANATHTNDDRQSRSHVRIDGTGTSGDGSGTRGISDSPNSDGRATGNDGSTNRKPRKSNSGADPVSPTRNDSIDLKVPKANTKKDTKKDISAILSDKETKDLQEPLVLALQAVFEWLDDFISFTNKAHAKATIWTQIDFEDVGKIASAILSLGKRQAQVAVAIRGIVVSYSYMEAGIITTQKFMETFAFYRKHGGFSLPGVF